MPAWLLARFQALFPGTTADILGLVADRFSLEITLRDIQEVVGTGQQQGRFVLANAYEAAYHEQPVEWFTGKALADIGGWRTVYFFSAGVTLVLLPILSRLLQGHRGLRALILVPTRELAAQVDYRSATGVPQGLTLTRFIRVVVDEPFRRVPVASQVRDAQVSSDARVGSPSSPVRWSERKSDS